MKIQQITPTDPKKFRDNFDLTLESADGRTAVELSITDAKLRNRARLGAIVHQRTGYQLSETSDEKEWESLLQKHGVAPKATSPIAPPPTESVTLESIKRKASYRFSEDDFEVTLRNHEKDPKSFSFVVPENVLCSLVLFVEACDRLVGKTVHFGEGQTDWLNEIRRLGPRIKAISP